MNPPGRSRVPLAGSLARRQTSSSFFSFKMSAEATAYADPENEEKMEAAIAELVKGDVYKRQTVAYLQDHELLDYAVLSEKAASASAHFNELSARIKAAEKRMAEIAVLREHIVGLSLIHI